MYQPLHLDRVWFPHFGRFPGSQFALPFVCPLDHVVNMDRQDASHFREYTFLTHPEVGLYKCVLGLYKCVCVWYCTNVMLLDV